MGDCFCFWSSFVWGSRTLRETTMWTTRSVRKKGGRHTRASIRLWSMVRWQVDPCLQPVEDLILQQGTAPKEGCNSEERQDWSSLSLRGPWPVVETHTSWRTVSHEKKATLQLGRTVSFSPEKEGAVEIAWDGLMTTPHSSPLCVIVGKEVAELGPGRGEGLGDAEY